MSRRILTDNLQLLRALYGPGGQLQAPLDIEFDLPLQLVHDVSRQVELGRLRSYHQSSLIAGDLPYFTIWDDDAFVDAATVRSTVGIYSNQSTAWALADWVVPDPDVETVWVLGFGAKTDTASSINVIEFYSDQGTKAGAGSGTPAIQILGTINGQIGRPDSNGDFHGEFDNRVIIQVPTPFPLLNKLTNNTPLEWTSVSLVTCVMDFWINCIRLPVGVTPPGLR